MDSEEPPNVRVAERGVAGFYVGPVADHINRAVGAAGGALRCEDLHLHRTDFEPTIETTYRGWRIHQTGLPSQGMILLEALNIAECEPASHLAEINAQGRGTPTRSSHSSLGVITRVMHCATVEAFGYSQVSTNARIARVHSSNAMVIQGRPTCSRSKTLAQTTSTSVWSIWMRSSGNVVSGVFRCAIRAGLPRRCSYRSRATFFPYFRPTRSRAGTPAKRLRKVL
ncbi:gamma-glutamyltransferase [Sphingobium xenophagum]|uniref:gamma-glutamyltransferase n=1 Tax=Sphingobium xenophagum TaxID=121428 RepID=UPI00351EB6B0